MLKVSRSQRSSSRSIPSGTTVLSVVWLGSHFEATAFQKGVQAGSWSSPTPVADLEAFAVALKEAKLQTRFNGSLASLVLAHPRLSQQLCEVPPAKDGALDRIVARLVDRQKTFEGEAAWSFRRTLPNKNAHNVLLFLFPRVLLDRLIQSFGKLEMNLETVVPCTAVLSGILPRLSLDADVVAMVAAQSGGLTAMLVGRGDGELLLGRVLETGDARDRENLAVELNRTSLFVTQQFGASVTGAYLLVEGGSDGRMELQSALEMSVHSATEIAGDFSWTQEVLKLAPEMGANLVSREQRQAPQRRLLLRVTTLVTALVVLGSVGIWFTFHGLVIEERLAVTGLKFRLSQLQQQHQTLQILHAELGRHREFIQVVDTDRSPPVPVWLLGYAGQAVPNGLVLTNLSVVRSDGGWNFRLAGMVQSLTNTVSTGAMAGLTNELATGPFHAAARVVNGTESSDRAVSPGGTLANLAVRLRPVREEAAKSSPMFAVEGFVK